MINYIKSELYRSIKNSNLKIMFIIFTVLIVASVLVLNYMMKVDPTFRYGNTRFSLGNVYAQMTMIFTVIVAFSAIMNDGEGNNTTKQSISFGVSRNNIYIGWFVVQAIVGILIYTIMSILLIVLSFLLLEHSNVNEISIFIRVTIGSATCLLAVLAVTYFFSMNSKSVVGALTLPIIIMVLIPSVLNIIGRKISLIKSIAYYLPYNLVGYDSKLVQSQSTIGIVLPLIIGLIWLVIFIFGGIYLFNKKEIK